MENTGEFHDQLLEEYADGGGRMKDWLEEKRVGSGREKLRWALTPSVVQHIGKKSSKVGSKEEWGTVERKDPRKRLWSFEFEKEGTRINRCGAGYG